MSMLEETQTADGDGYNTPNSFEQCNIAGGQMDDQFALTLLRLQHGLDQAVGRIDRLEELVKQTLDKLRSLRDQTNPKQRVLSEPSSGGRTTKAANGFWRQSISSIRSTGTVLWFYLSYPIVVHLILRALERRRRAHQSSLW
jgi:hypothetical protein